MGKLIDEFRKGWQGMAPPSLGLSLAFAVACLLVATLARWALAHVRPDAETLGPEESGRPFHLASLSTRTRKRRLPNSTFK